MDESKRAAYRKLYGANATTPPPGSPPKTRPPKKTTVQPQSGPGTHLHAMLQQMGFRITETCSCRSHIAEMNRLGPDGCRAIKDQIVRWLSEAKETVGLTTYVSAGTKAAWNRLPLTVAGLVDEAIRRAEE